MKTKRKPAKNKRRNPKVSDIKLRLTKEEYAVLEFLSSQNEAARILVDAYDPETGGWNRNIVAEAYNETGNNGGRLGIVSGASGSLKKKITELFETLLVEWLF